MAVIVFYVFALILRAADQSGPHAAPTTVMMSAGGMLAVAVSAYLGRRIHHHPAGKEPDTG
jgi:hypothetical protein